MPTYRTLAIATALLCLVLALVWGFAARPLLSLWGIEPTDAAEFAGRRMAALFLCLAVTLWWARNARPSPERKAVSVGIASGCGALAVIGTLEFIGGNANGLIFSAVAVEALLMLSFLSIERRSA